MWEYRVSWKSARPSWWDQAWTSGTRGLTAVGRRPEARLDTYWIIDGRSDVGIKRRGAKEHFLEIKVRYAQRNRWELWEKVFFQTWTRLESERCAALLQIEPAFDSKTMNPVDGMKALLTRAGLSWREQLVRKKRLQTSAHALLTGVPGLSIDHHCLGELVEFRVAERDEPVWSLCLETAEPAGITHSDAGTAILGGYPELLSR
jgi:hypothetical protein